MPAEQQKSGKWRIRKKDGTLGKRDFTSKKNALAAQRSGAKAGKKKPGKAVAKKPAGGAATTTSRKIGTGRSYQGVRLTMLILSPATDETFGIAAGGQTVSGAWDKIKNDVQSKPYLSHLGIVAADVAIDTNPKVGQAAALSRGSITAWAPEVFVFAKGVEDRQAGATARQIHARAILRETGYDPISGTWVPQRMRDYRMIKHGGQVIRYAGSHFKMAERLKRRIQESFLRPLDLTL